ncbi:hypothetical protein E6H31_03695 [Candidatus Bathyarchaeota archaeon]|nr:MAG: hypothetical protein E6H31_03695 [Candidatus Bathyarchaeota archaeon]
MPLASYLLWAVFAVAWWSDGAGLGTSDLTLVISGLGTLGLAASAAGSYLVFILVNRANEHSSRTRALLLSALSALEARVGISGTQALLPLNSAEEGFNKLAEVERERSAVLWALLSLIPFVGWIFLAVAQLRLSRDLANHNRLEGLVFEDVDRTLRSIGMQGIPVRYAPVRPHDTLGIIVVICSVIELFSAFVLGAAGALILVYLTIGAFSIFWIDLSIRDPTGHFHYHSKLEADILRALPDGTSTSAGVA